MRVVFDTNIFVSAFAIPGGRAEDAFLHATRGGVVLFTSVSILTETANVLRSKFDWSDTRIRELLALIHQMADVRKTTRNFHVLQDEPDNRILECALEAAADLIVTGDRHLLELKGYQGISMITLSDFLSRVKPA